MDRYRAMRLSGVLLILTGIVLMAWAALEGQASFALVLVIPVLYGTGPLAAVAGLAIFSGVVLVFLSFIRAAEGAEAEETPEGVKKEWGGVILIGPIPIVIGSAGMLKGRRAIILLAVLSMLVLALFLFTFLR